jgi:hypothetical protein
VPVSAGKLTTRASTVLVGVLTGGLAVAGGASLPRTGAVAVVLAGVVAAGLAAGIARASGGMPSRARAVRAADRAAVGAVGVLLVLNGCVVLAGVFAPAVVVGWAGVVVLVWWLRRRERRRARQARPEASAAPFRLPAGPASRRRRHPSARGAGPAPPVAFPTPEADLFGLSIEALGQEWLRSSAILEAPVDPATRARIVHRRQQALDELERRDPVGFARWLAAGATVDSNPAQYLRGDSSAGSGTT